MQSMVTKMKEDTLLDHLKLIVTMLLELEP